MKESEIANWLHTLDYVHQVNSMKPMRKRIKLIVEDKFSECHQQVYVTVQYSTKQ